MADMVTFWGEVTPDGPIAAGRPPHAPTDATRAAVLTGLALRWSDERIAQGLGITPPTLRKHYRAQLKHREAARAMVEMRAMAGLLHKVGEGNVAAFRELQRQLDRADLAAGAAAFAGTAQPRPAAAKAAKLGKKELADQAAREAGSGTDWGDDLLGGLH